MIDDIFCKIIRGEIKSEAVYEDDQCLAIRDIHPQAPVHILIIPKVHIEALYDATDIQEAMLGHLLHVAPRIAEQEKLEKGYRLIINEGEHAGKLVPHLHIHLLGGQQLGPKMVG